jgi:hypothetical protein
MVIKLGFADFWEGFPLDKNFFTDAIEQATGIKPVSVEPGHADIVVWSVFGADGERNKFSGLSRDKVNWYFTGENYAPDVEKFDLSFSFIPGELPKHFRLPIWWLYCDWADEFQTGNVHDDKINPKLLHKPRHISTLSHKSVSIFINNPEPRRIKAVQELEKYFPVAKYGGYYENPVDSKLSIGRDHRFNLCFENELSPGYHTEKLLHAWSMRAVPLYLGDTTINAEFNPKSFVNLNDFESIADFVSFVSKMSDEDCLAMVNEPLLNQEITLEELYARLRSELSSFFT